MSQPDSSRLEPYFRYLAGLMLLLLVFCLNYNTIQSNDTWWHLELGRYMSDTMSIIRHDHYSAVLDGKPFIAFEWLTEVIFYNISDFHAQNLTYFKLCLMMLGTAVFLRLICKPYRFGLWSLLLVMLLCYLMACRAHMRPQLLGMWFVVALVTTLTLWRRQQKTKYLWMLLPLQVFWVNCHGSFLIAPVLTTAMVVALWAEKKLPWLRTWPTDNISTEDLYKISCVPVLLVAMSLINPYHYHLLGQTLGIVDHSSFMTSHIKEWTSITSADPGQYWVYAWFVWQIAAWTLVLLSWKKRSFVDITMLIIATYLPLSANRHIAISAIIGFPILLKNLNAVHAQTFCPRKMIMVLVLPILYLAANGTPYSAQEHKPLGAGFNYRQVPLATLQYLKRTDAKGVVMNHYDDGGYIMHYLAPNIRQVMDSRTDLYGEALYMEHRKAFTSVSAFRHYLEKYHASYALLKLSPHYQALRAHLIEDPEWTVATIDPLRVLFARNPPK